MRDVVAGFAFTIQWIADPEPDERDRPAARMLGSYAKNAILCVDTGADLQEDFTPQAADSYYLVVPHNWADEGAYGLDFDPTRVPPRIERPQAALPADRCAPTQVVTPCP